MASKPLVVIKTSFKMYSLKFFLMISSVLLLSCSFSQAHLFDSFNFNRTIDLDRSAEKEFSYFLNSIDITTFKVNHKVFLTEFSFPKFYSYENGVETDVNDVDAIIVLFEKNQTTEMKTMLFRANKTLNSTQEIRIVFESHIQINPGHLYEIALVTPKEYHLVFKHVEGFGEYDFFAVFKSMRVNIFRSNRNLKPNFATKTDLHAADGAVQKMLFNWQAFQKD